MNEEEAGKRFVKGTFNYQMQLSQPHGTPRTLTVTGHIYDTDTPEEINRRIDEAQDSIERAYARAELFSMIEQRKNMMQGLENLEEQLQDLTARQSMRTEGLSAEAPKPRKLSAMELENIKKGQSNKRLLKDNIVKIDAAIEATREKLGMSAA
jgi:hypothetical protein